MIPGTSCRTGLAPVIWPEGPAPKGRIRLARLSAPRSAFQFGRLKAGFHFVPEGHTIVARRFIAGLAVHRVCVPEGRLKLDLGCRGKRIGVWAHRRMGMPV